MVEHMAQVAERVGAGHLCENLSENDDFEARYYWYENIKTALKTIG
jgi:hypothetical protein